MSLFNSVIGSLSPKFRNSFEDPRAHEHELPLYKSPPLSPRIPPPIASSVLWSAPNTSLSPPQRVSDDLLALQRKARHLEQQLQELLDAQADGLMGGLTGNEPNSDDLVSNGSTTPTVSSVRDHDRDQENGDNGRNRKKKVSLNAARKGISRRIQQLASVKAEEMDILDEDARDLQTVVEKTERWVQKRSRLEKKVKDIEGETAGVRTRALRNDASKLEQEIRLKEEELWALKARHRRVLNELADSENSVEARLASYKASLSILDKEITGFLIRPQVPDHVPLSSSPFLSLPPKRRTLEMAHDYWHEEHARLIEKCQEVDMDRAALDDGVVLWNNVVKKILSFEATLQDHMQQAGGSTKPDSSNLISLMEGTVAYLEEKLNLATSRSWNLLVCAIGAELEAFRQGQDILLEALGVCKKGKEKALPSLIDTESSSHAESEEEGSSSAIRISQSSPKPRTQPQARFFDTDDEDPDPELLISHQDTDTD